MLVELAVGDAYGAGFEFTEPPPPNDLRTYHSHLTMRPTPIGRYTDDTQMSIGTTEALLSEGDLSPLKFAEAWVRAFKRDPHTGYSSKFYKLLQEVRDGKELLEAINPLSDRSGCCMRVLPVSYMPTLEGVKYLARLQAAVTHNTPIALECAEGVAAAGWFLRMGLRPITLGTQLYSLNKRSSWGGEWGDRPVGVSAFDCAHAAVSIVRTSTSLSEILWRACKLTGDVDTVAAIACGLGALSTDIAQDLPDELVSKLENGPYGRAYLVKLDNQLQALVL